MLMEALRSSLLTFTLRWSEHLLPEKESVGRKYLNLALCHSTLCFMKYKSDRRRDVDKLESIQEEPQ